MSSSAELFAQAQQRIPGGVNSPVRAFKSVGGSPLFFTRGEGAYVYTAEGTRYLDYVGSWGPLILGHADPIVVRAVQQAAALGLSFGAPTEVETEMATLLCRLMPTLEQVRLVNSGTEATLSAIRLARGFTRRDKIIKFEGCYHGHSDSLLVKAGSGVLTLGVPDSAGVPQDIAKHTLIAPYNDLSYVREQFAQFGDEIAAVIVEPVAGNMGCILPLPDFLPGLRELCTEYGSLLIFDEVMTGFRVALGGAQAYYQVQPDLTTLGKVIGGGLPVGAFGGRRDIMEHLAPLGPVYQAGTLSGNPIAMAAGIATLTAIQQLHFYEQLNATTQQLVRGLQQCAQQAGINLKGNCLGGMFGIFFTTQASVDNYQQVAACNQQLFNRFFHGMLAEGIYLAPSMYEAGFVSSKHSQEEIAITLAAASKVFAQL